jgi:hypothetical protein
VGEARLAQDAHIQARFLADWNTTLNTNIAFATRARKAVENARLMLDAAKARAKQRTGGAAAGGWAGGGRRVGVDDDGHISEEARLDVEQAEDEFVGLTEEAVGVMKNVCGKYPPKNPGKSNETLRAEKKEERTTSKADHTWLSLQVLDTPEPLRSLAELIAAQLEYHKKAYEILSELAPEVDALQVDQEVSHPCFPSYLALSEVSF